MKNTTNAMFEGRYECEVGGLMTVSIENENTYLLEYDSDDESNAYVDAEEFHHSSYHGNVMPVDGRILP